MLNYILKRVVGMIPILLGITFLTYLAMFLAPGGPAAFMNDLNPKVSPEVKEKLIKLYELDKPVHIQYLKWLKRIAKLDFGLSIKDNQPVIRKIWERLPRTMLLSGISLITIFFVAVPIGVFSAIRQNSFLDRAMTVFVFLGFSIPTYWVALLCMIVFGIHLGWVPITGFRSILSDDWPLLHRCWDVAKHLILPVSVMTLTGLSGLSRYMRNGMLEVIRQDYIRTARAKGLSENRVIWVHALRNTLIPVVTLLGLSLPDLISAGVIFEIIFSFPGLGRLGYDAVMARDFPVIIATGFFSAILTLAGNFISDVCYAYADPRIRYRS